MQPAAGHQPAGWLGKGAQGNKARIVEWRDEPPDIEVELGGIAWAM